MTSFATTPGGSRIAYQTSGSVARPALILTHSLGSDHHLWDAQVDASSDRFYVVACDHVGHGQSDVPPGDYDIAQLAAASLTVADAEGLERFHFCGMSVGGLVGQWIGINQPERLLSLTLCNTAARIGTAELWDQRVVIARTDGMTALVDSVMERWFSSGFADAHPEHFARSRTTLLATDPNGYAGVCAALRDADLRDAVGSITVPTLVIGGTRDQATPIEQARWLHEQIADSKLVELEAAHIGCLDSGPAFTVALAGFLDELTATC